MKWISKVLVGGVTLAALLVGSIGLTGCGDSNSNQQRDPIVVNGGDTEGNNDLSRYTNADWLYENYFDEYGFPEELKTIMLPELKMVANGFTLQFALEKDPEAVVEKFNSVMLALKVSGKFDVFANELMSDLESGEYVFDDTNSSIDSNRTIQISDSRITAEAQEHINKAKKEQAIYKKEQEDLVKKYNLPYLLPKKITKVIIYSALMGKKGKKRRRTPEQPKFKRVNKFNWYHGEWFYVNAHKGYQNTYIEYGHSGIIDVYTNRHTKYVIDAMPDVGVNLAYWPDSLYVYPKHITSWSNNRHVSMFDSESRPYKK